MSLPVWARDASNRCLSRPARWAQARRTNSRTSSTPKCARAQWPFPTPSKRWRPTGTRPGSTTSGRRPPRRGHSLRPRRSLPLRHRPRAAAVLITRTARRLGRLAPPPCTVVIPAIGPGWTGTATASPASDGEPPSVQGCWSDRLLRQLSAQPARELAKLLNIAVTATPWSSSLCTVGPVAVRGDQHDRDADRAQQHPALAAGGHRLLDPDRADAGGYLRRPWRPTRGS